MLFVFLWLLFETCNAKLIEPDQVMTHKVDMENVHQTGSITGKSQQSEVNHHNEIVLNEISLGINREVEIGLAEIGSDNYEKKINKDQEKIRQAEQQNEQDKSDRQLSIPSNEEKRLPAYVSAYILDDEKFCTEVKKSKSIADFVDIAQKIANFNPSNYYKLDTTDQILQRWIGEEITKIITAIHDEHLRHFTGYYDERAAENYMNEIANSWYESANKCALEIKDSPLLYAFATSQGNYENLKDKLGTFYTKSPEERYVDSSGNIVTKPPTVTTKDKIYGIDKIRLRGTKLAMTTNWIPSLMIILDPNGTVLNKVFPEIKKEMNNRLAEMVNTKLFEEEKIINQKKWGKQVRNVNFKSAKSCREIIDVLKSDPIVNIDWNNQASHNPHGGLKVGIGKLVSYDENKIGRGKGYVSNFPAEIRTSSNTIWYNKEAIRINQGVSFLGEYVENTSIVSIDGQNVTAPVLELICIDRTSHEEDIIQAEEEIKQEKRAKQIEKEKIHKEKIRKGNYQLAKSCGEIINVLENVDRSQQAALKPHKGFMAGVGKLVNYEENKIGKGRGYVSNPPAEIRTSSNTIWYNKDKIRMNRDVVFLGKYIENTSIALTDGQNITSPVLELICIEQSWLFN